MSWALCRPSPFSSHLEIGSSSEKNWFILRGLVDGTRHPTLVPNYTHRPANRTFLNVSNRTMNDHSQSYQPGVILYCAQGVIYAEREAVQSLLGFSLFSPHSWLACGSSNQTHCAVGESDFPHRVLVSSLPPSSYPLSSSSRCKSWPQGVHSATGAYWYHGGRQTRVLGPKAWTFPCRDFVWPRLLS